MEAYAPVTKRSWFYSCLTLWMLATVFEKALMPVDRWLSNQGEARYLGLLFTPLAMFMAGFSSSYGCFRRHGHEGSLVTKQKLFVPVFLMAWSIVSVMAIGLIGKFPVGFPTYALFFILQACVGCVLAYGAVLYSASRWHRHWAE